MCKDKNFFTNTTTYLLIFLQNNIQPLNYNEIFIKSSKSYSEIR